MMTPKQIVGLIVTVCIITTACGYRFTRAGNFPSGVERIFIQIFENRTSEIGVENDIANELADQFTSRGNSTALVSSAKNADAVLTGVIASIQITTTSRVTETIASARRVILTVDSKLTTSDDRTIWSAQRVAATDSYTVVPDSKEATEDNKRLALARVANQLAEILYNRLVEDF
jgi:outer membrane lipopolysaccharide assembly protein LptE/RlpB